MEKLSHKSRKNSIPSTRDKWNTNSGMIIDNDRWLGVTRHNSVRERGAMGSDKPHKQAASQRSTKIRLNSKYEL